KDTVQEAIAFNKGNIETNTANIEGNRTAIATKADKDADNLSVDDVNAWTTKLNNEANLAAPKGKLVTDTQVKAALETKLETGDIKSSDKTVGITTAAGNVDLRVNLDNTSLTKNGNGVIGIADGGVTTAKIADGNVTKAKLADDVTTILDKVGTGAIETANHNTVTGDVVKTYVDGKVATINTEVTNLGNTVNTLGDTITHVGKTSKETVKADNGSGINVKTTPATNEKGAIFTLSLDEDEVKALAGTTNLDTTYLKTDGSNVANKATFGDQVGTDTLGTSTKLAQIKAVKAVDDKVNTNTQDITDLEESVTTKLAKKANHNASNLNANDVAAWKAKIDTNSIETVTAGEGIDVSGGTAATNKEWVVALSQKTKTQLEKIDDNAAALANKANISLDNISSDGTTVIKNAARDAVEVAVNPATEGVLKLVKTASAANHKDTYTLSIDETKLNDKVAETFAKKDAGNLTDGDIADWKQALDIGNVLTQANLADRLLLTGSNVGSDDNKVKLGKNVGKGEITGDTTQLVQEKAVKAYVDAAKADVITNIDNSVTNAMGNQTIAYKAGSTTKTVKLSEGFNFTNGTDTVASVGDNGDVSFDLNDTAKGQLASIADKLDRAALKTIESDDITVSNGGDLTAGKVKLTLKEARVKALAGTTNLETDYLKVDGSNIANNKATFGDAVGTTDLTKTTELAQIKAVKDVDDKVKTNTTAITNLNTDLTTQITNVGKTSKEEVAVKPNSGLTLDTTAATASKGAKYTLGLDADKIKEITGTTTLADDLAAKADRDAGNLGTTDVTKWKEKLGIEGLTSDTVAGKLNASDITSVDKTVIIDTTGANGKGKVDLTVNLDGITLTKDNNGVISLADNGVTTNKIKDGNVTQAKLHTDVTNILNKVGTGAVETGNQNTVTGDVVKTYVDNSVGAVETKVTNLGDQITNVGKTSKEEVAVKPNSGLTLDTTAATTDKGAKYTLGLDVDKIKEITGTTNLATTYLKIDGSNIGDEAAKATLGSKVGKGEITGDTTQLVQEKAV
ncbi:hypothetical protein QJT92_10785, partial [Pasteurella skyensis]|nr:hypothetical protein [Pasteurella skyensis]